MIISTGAWENWFLQQQRVWLVGGPGSYKTLFTLGLYDWLWHTGRVDRFYSNFPTVWTDKELMLNSDGKMNALIGLDEIGLFAKHRGDVESFLAYCRRLGNYIVFSSTEPPPVSCRAFQISCIWSLIKYGVGGVRVPFVLYQCRYYTPPYRNQTDYFLFTPFEYMGLYDTWSWNSTSNNLEKVFAYIMGQIEGRYYDKNQEYITSANDGISLEAEGYEPVWYVPEGCEKRDGLSVPSEKLQNGLMAGQSAQELAEALAEFTQAVASVPVRRKR